MGLRSVIIFFQEELEGHSMRVEDLLANESSKRFIKNGTFACPNASQALRVVSCLRAANLAQSEPPLAKKQMRVCSLSLSLWQGKTPFGQQWNLVGPDPFRAVLCYVGFLAGREVGCLQGWGITYKQPALQRKKGVGIQQ